MSKSKFGASVLALALLTAGTANADNDFGAGIKIGTLGYGIEARWQPLPLVDLRVGANTYELDTSGLQAGINYDAAFNMETIYLTANLRFPASPFRVTAGAFSNGNELDMVSTDSSSFIVGGLPYSGADVGTLTSVTSFASTSPYLGIGYDFELFGKAGLNFDLGILWQGEPDVTLDASGFAADDDIFQAALEVERQELEDKASSLKAWPVISLGFVYNF